MNIKSKKAPIGVAAVVLWSTLVSLTSVQAIELAETQIKELTPQRIRELDSHSEFPVKLELPKDGLNVSVFVADKNGAMLEVSHNNDKTELDVNQLNYDVCSSLISEACAAFENTGSELNNDVPEPSSSVLIGLACFVAILRRRH